MKQIFIRYGGEPPKVETASDEITLSDGTTRPNTAAARAAYQAERRRFIEAQQRQLDKLNAQRTGRGCPIQYEIDQGHPRECKTNCAFYRGGGCMFAGQAATVDTKGGSCPFMYGKPCNGSCMMYDGGCTLLTNCKGE